MPGFERASRISLRLTTFEAAALFIFAGMTATPSSRAAAADKTTSWASAAQVQSDFEHRSWSALHKELSFRGGVGSAS
jgi:hypothetical protein